MAVKKPLTEGQVVCAFITDAEEALAHAMGAYPGDSKGHFDLAYCKDQVQRAQRACGEAVRHLVVMQLRLAKDPGYQAGLEQHNPDAQTTLVRPHKRTRVKKEREDPGPAPTVPASDTVAEEISS